MPLPGAAALRSAVVPGWGQWVTGHRLRGLIVVVVATLLVGTPLVAGALMLSPLLALIAPPPFAEVAGWIAAQTRGWVNLHALAGAMPHLTDWSVVWWLLIGANTFLALLRGWAALDAALAARRARRLNAAAWLTGRRAPVLSVTASSLAFALVVGPHLAIHLATEAARPLVAPMFQPTPRPTNPLATPVPVVPADEPPVPLWDGTSRLNVLLMGSDRRPDEMAIRPWGNSDTLLVVSIEAGLRSAAMISIPRDLLVEIPGVGTDKINAAYRQGGPNLAIRVVSNLINQPIHRWASVEVDAFGKMIDAVGGVIVDIEKPLRDDEYPTDDYGVRRVFLPAGLTWLEGEQALVFARSRHGSNDFERAARQQRLLVALKSRLRDPRLVARLPVLISTLADAIQTDVTPREALALASLGASTDIGSIRSLVLAPPAFGREIIRPDLYAITPDVPRIRAGVAALLAPGSTPATVSSAITALEELPILANDVVLGKGGAGSLEPDGE